MGLGFDSELGVFTSVGFFRNTELSGLVGGCGAMGPRGRAAVLVKAFVSHACNDCRPSFHENRDTAGTPLRRA